MLEIKDLSVYYGRIQALRGISLRLEEGELVALIGSNGAGKTTTLRTISGLLKPASGSITFEDKKIDGLSPHLILKLGICQVPEGWQLFDEMTVTENLEIGALISKGNFDKKTKEVFKYFPVLRIRQKQIAGTLSGGERQMLAIARGLMSDPKLLLLDEPSLGLAPIIVENLAEIITNLNQQGISMLLVEQNARLALSLANGAYVLEAGEIITEGSAKELEENKLVAKAYLGI